MKGLSKEEKILMFSYAAIAVAYGFLFYIKYKHISEKA